MNTNLSLTKNISIEPTSARKAAWELFKTYHGHTDFYGDPETGKIELRFSGMLPPYGYEWIASLDEGYIYYNQESCQTFTELANAFNYYWNGGGRAEFIADLETCWQNVRQA